MAHTCCNPSTQRSAWSTQVQTHPGLQSKALSHKKSKRLQQHKHFRNICSKPRLHQQPRKQTYSPGHMTESHQFKDTSTPFFSDCQWKLLTKWAHWLRKEQQPNLTCTFTAQQSQSWQTVMAMAQGLNLSAKSTNALFLSSSGWTDLPSAITLTWELWLFLKTMPTTSPPSGLSSVLCKYVHPSQDRSGPYSQQTASPASLRSCCPVHSEFCKLKESQSGCYRDVPMF